MTRTRIVGDLSELPQSVFSWRSIIWWGVFGFMLIEGTAFVLAGGAYLYLIGVNETWPPQPIAPPDLLWGSVLTLGLVASVAPNLWLEKRSHAHDERAVRMGTLLMVVIGLALTAVRAAEFPHLNVRWDQNAYGSVTWLLIVLHTAHLITDLLDTMVVCVWLFTHEVGPDQFSDAADNCAYWNFVILSWLPIYGLIYLAPRLV